jgi:hypothetical protein
MHDNESKKHSFCRIQERTECKIVELGTLTTSDVVA